MSRSSEKRIIAQDLLRQGKPESYIAEVTGLAIQTIRNYKWELAGEELPDKAVKELGRKNRKMREDFPQDWTAAVNRMRRYFGMEPFPMPIDPWNTDTGQQDYI